MNLAIWTRTCHSTILSRKIRPAGRDKEVEPLVDAEVSNLVEISEVETVALAISYQETDVELQVASSRETDHR